MFLGLYTTNSEKKCERWVRRAQGDIRQFDLLASNVDIQTDKSLAKYVIKGVDQRYIAYFHMQSYAAPQGRIWGRRAGTSPSISRTARNKAGFFPKRDRHKWKQSPANDDDVVAVA